MITPAHQKWNKDNGDNTLRLEYNLNTESVVIDAGGYEGKWSEIIYQRYQPNIYIFEPIKDCAYKIGMKYFDYDKVKVYAVGLSNENKQAELNVFSDSSSIHTNNGVKETISLIDFSQFMEQNNLSNIDLMKINIEGDEFDLLEGMIKSGKILNVDNIQVQFHSHIPDAVNRRNAIRTELAKTHYLTYDYEFIWENWRRKSVNASLRTDK